MSLTFYQGLRFAKGLTKCNSLNRLENSQLQFLMHN